LRRVQDRTPLRPLAVGEILDVAINIVLKNWRTLLKAVVVVVIPLQMLSIAILATTVSDADLINNQNAFSGKDPDMNISGSDVSALAVGYGLVAILGFVLTAFATAACFKAVSDAYLGAKPDWRESLRFARARFASVLWVTCLVGLGVVLGLFAFIIPGIWLYVGWAMAVPALLFAGVKGPQALGRSRRLVKGRWWPTFGTLLVGFVLAGVTGGILGALVSAVSLTAVGDSVFGAAAVNGLSSGIAQIVTTPVTVAILTVIYYDLRVRKDGVDLETLTERFGITPDPAKLPRAAQPAGARTAAGPPPTAPGWQAPPPAGAWQAPPPQQPWEGAAGWQQPQPPRASEASAPPDPDPSPAPPAVPDEGDWAPPRPPGGGNEG
jgi:hypothetical protein